MPNTIVLQAPGHGLLNLITSKDIYVEDKQCLVGGVRYTMTDCHPSTDDELDWTNGWNLVPHTPIECMV